MMSRAMGILAHDPLCHGEQTYTRANQIQRLKDLIVRMYAL
jgi:hypothetical protein